MDADKVVKRKIGPLVQWLERQAVNLVTRVQLPHGSLTGTPPLWSCDS